MATLYIKHAKKCKKSFYSKLQGEGYDPFWPGGGYAHGRIGNGIWVKHFYPWCFY